MTTLITLGGILLLSGLGFWWAVDTGKRLNQAKSLRERVDKVANVNEFNRKEYEELNRQIQICPACNRAVVLFYPHLSE